MPGRPSHPISIGWTIPTNYPPSDALSPGKCRARLGGLARAQYGGRLHVATRRLPWYCHGRSGPSLNQPGTEASTIPTQLPGRRADAQVLRTGHASDSGSPTRSPVGFYGSSIADAIGGPPLGPCRIIDLARSMYRRPRNMITRLPHPGNRWPSPGNSASHSGEASAAGAETPANPESADCSNAVFIDLR